MKRRSITDEEISLIKAMVARGMANKDIQFFLNRPDRSVNSGRITEIAKGRYSNSAEIEEATDSQLEKFFEDFQETPISASISIPHSGKVNYEFSPVDPRYIRQLFEEISAGVFALRSNESEVIECKTSFGFRHADKWLPTIAGMANNKGGHIFFGVGDENPPDGKNNRHSVVGLRDNQFFGTDPAKFHSLLKSNFDPTPSIQVNTISIGEENVGVLYVEKEKNKPVIATRVNGIKIKEGDIFYRYLGETAKIKYSELRAILDERDAAVRKSLAPLISKIIEIGPEKALVANVEDIDAKDGEFIFQVEREDIDKFRFIKEGSFVEKDGAPTLRMLGEARFKGTENNAVNRKFVTTWDLIQDFIQQKVPSNPEEYVRCAVEGSNISWLPFHYFAQVGKISSDRIYEMIEDSHAPKRRKSKFLNRVNKNTAYRKASGTPLLFLKRIKSGNIDGLFSSKDVGNISLAIIALEVAPVEDPTPLLKLLELCYSAAENSELGSAISVVRKAICRVDEIYFAKR